MKNIRTYGIHDQFSLKEENKESLSVVTNNSTSLVIDCPSHTVKSLANDTNLITKSVQTKVDYLFITHLDNDHISGIDSLLWWKVFAEKQKLNLITHPEIYSKLWDRIKHGFGQDRTKSIEASMNIGDYINFIPLDYSDEVVIPGFGKIRSFYRATKHYPGMDMLAIQVFDENGNNIANFSGDTAIDRELIDFLSEGGGSIIHEVGAYSDGSSSHTSIRDLLENIPEDIHSRLFLNHIPEIKESEIRTTIEEEGSPISLADNFFTDNYNKINSLNNTKQRPVVFSGSFDPWTNGHESVVKEYLKVNPSGKVVIVIGVNSDKKATFSPEERKVLIEKSLDKSIRNNVEVEMYSGVIADYVYENNFAGIIKGIRNSADFDYEKDIAGATKRFSGDVTTLLFPQTQSAISGVSSSSLKTLSKFGGEISSHASPVVREALRMKQSGQFIVGLTGGIASGKSSFGKALQKYSIDKDLKIHYINMDDIVKEIHERTDLEIFINTRKGILKYFLEDVLNKDGTTNKKVLGEIVFNDSEKMEELMSIIMEPMIHFLRKKVLEIKGSGVIIIEGAVIFDRKLTYIFDENIMHIGVDRETQEKRVKKRDGFNDEQIKARLDNQLSREQRVSGIRSIQANYEDRFFMDIDGEGYNLEEIYNELVGEYDRRKKIK